MYSIWQFAYSSPERLSQIMKIPTWNDLLYKSKMTASVSHPNTNIILRIRCRKHLGGCSSMAQLVKNPPAMQETLISRLERSSGEGKGYPLQCSGLENSMDCIVHGIAESWIWLSNIHLKRYYSKRKRKYHLENRKIEKKLRLFQRPSAWYPPKMQRNWLPGRAGCRMRQRQRHKGRMICQLTQNKIPN